MLYITLKTILVHSLNKSSKQTANLASNFLVIKARFFLQNVSLFGT